MTFISLQITKFPTLQPYVSTIIGKKLILCIITQNIVAVVKERYIYYNGRFDCFPAVNDIFGEIS